jgi:hypothetical protein
MWDKLRDAAGEGMGGKQSGMSLLVRRLIYRELREPFPEGGLDDLLALAAKLEELTTWKDPELIEAMFDDLAAMSQQETDLVRRNFVLQILGTIAVGCFETTPELLTFTRPPKRKT